MTGSARFSRLSRMAVTAAVSLTLMSAQEGGGAAGGGQQGGGAGGGQQGGGGQPGGGTAPGGGTQPGGGGSIGRPPGQIGQQPGQQDPFGRSPSQRFPDMQRMIYLSGKVVMDDGTPPPELVVIERVCNGIPRPEGYTDSKGRFSFQLGQNQGVFADASVSAMGDMSPMGRQTGVSERDLVGCEIRAALAGFRSSVVQLTGRRALDNPDVGTLILHRLAKVEGFTFSATSALAPKDAKKAFEKGREALRKQKFPDAEKELSKAVQVYPKYAAAWYELGVTYQQQKKIEEARNAYKQSVEADSKFVSPYPQLARLAAVEKKWDEVTQYTDKVLKLNPYLSPEIYFYSAVANYNLQKMDIAEEHAREAAKMDEKHRNPRINQLLGVILAEKRDYKGAAENMRIFLKAFPDAPDAAMVKNQLAELERLEGGAPVAQQP